MAKFKRAKVFKPLEKPARYKGAHGGRGSGKSHWFAEQVVLLHAASEGRRTVCIREVQKSLKDSAKRLIEDKIEMFGLGKAFEVQTGLIKTPGDGLITFQGMQDHTAESIKSLEGFDCAWVEEAQTLSERSLTLLRPTIRDEGSEIWASWNPTRKSDPIDVLLRGDNPPESIVVQANWKDNGFFPAVLEQERLYDQENYPDRYEHVWEGGYATVTEGAYFAAGLTKARQDKRIGEVAADPLMRYQAFWDIGGSGARADATSIWICQFIGRQVLVLDYYEAQGQPLATHVNWLRDNGYESALCVLPHDGSTNDKVYDISFESALRGAGFTVNVVQNQGRGAAKQRIEAVRRLFGSIWFNEKTTEAGREALGWYHERKDEKRQIGLGPDHDWSSHAADAFGLMAISYEAPKEGVKRPKKRRSGEGAWMG